MPETRFDALTRRASIAGLGAAALLAAVPATAGASKVGKKAKKRCKKQVGACRSRTLARCEGGAGCEDAFLPCCDFLAACNAAAYVDCVFDGIP